MNDSQSQLHGEVARFEDDQDGLRLENARLAGQLAAVERDASDLRRPRAQAEALFAWADRKRRC